jgi:cytochrome P450
LFDIIENRIKDVNNPERDFIYSYITEMKEIDEKIAAAEKAGQSHNYRRITKEEIVQQLISFYFAGIDTTGHLISMALYALAEYK